MRERGAFLNLISLPRPSVLCKVNLFAYCAEDPSPIQHADEHAFFCWDWSADIWFNGQAARALCGRAEFDPTCGDLRVFFCSAGIFPTVNFGPNRHGPK